MTPDANAPGPMTAPLPMMVPGLILELMPVETPSPMIAPSFSRPVSRPLTLMLALSSRRLAI